VAERKGRNPSITYSKQEDQSYFSEKLATIDGNEPSIDEMKLFQRFVDRKEIK
jgi:hypothetical protein